MPGTRAVSRAGQDALRRGRRSINTKHRPGYTEQPSTAAVRLVEAIRDPRDPEKVLKGITRATVNATAQGGETPLHHCSGGKNGDQEYPQNPQAAKALIDRGGNVHAFNQAGETPLHTAAKRGATEVAKVLIEHGLASVAIPSKTGESALHIAASHHRKGTAELLLGHGADVNIRDYEFMTPLHVAAEYHSVEVAKLLLGSGAEVNALDMFGKTALHYAAAAHDIEKGAALAKMLVEAGADATIPDYAKHYTPADCVQVGSDPAGSTLVKLLLKTKEEQLASRAAPPSPGAADSVAVPNPAAAAGNSA